MKSYLFKIAYLNIYQKVMSKILFQKLDKLNTSFLQSCKEQLSQAVCAENENAGAECLTKIAHLMQESFLQLKLGIVQLQAELRTFQKRANLQH